MGAKWVCSVRIHSVGVGPTVPGDDDRLLVIAAARIEGANCGRAGLRIEADVEVDVARGPWNQSAQYSAEAAAVERNPLHQHPVLVESRAREAAAGNDACN